MSRMSLRELFMVGVAAAALEPGSATAQSQTGARSVAPATTSPLSNPYANPYINPYMMITPMSRDAALLSLLAAQRSSGGIGSGRLSDSSAAQTSRPAEMPDSLSRPGGAASQYFLRGSSGPRSDRSFYQRHNRYFGSNGR